MIDFVRANSSMMSISRRCDWKRVYLVSFFEFLHSIERSSMDYIIFAVGSFFTHENAFYGDILCSHCVSNVLIGKWVFWWFGDVIPKMVKLTRMLQQQWAHEHSLKIWYMALQKQRAKRRIWCNCRIWSSAAQIWWRKIVCWLSSKRHLGFYIEFQR